MSAGRQNGVALFVTLVLLTALMLLAAAGARLTLQAERMARNDRDRAVARIAAEAALRDAMTEIGTPGPKRDWLMTPVPCGTRGDIPAGGLCGQTEPDFEEPGDSTPIGSATGATLQTGEGPLPAQPPRYAVIAGPGNTLRLIALAYGARPATRVRLERVCTRLPQPAC